MIIVVEGIDKVGKTTLANNLAKELDFKHPIRVFKGDEWLNKFIGPYKVNDYFEDLVIMDVADKLKVDVVLDRSLPSGSIYRMIKGGGLLYRNVMVWWYEKLSKNNGVYIWVDANMEKVYDNFEKCGDKMRYDLFDYDEMKKQFSNYYYAAMTYSIKCIKIDTSESTPEQSLKEVLEQL